MMSAQKRNENSSEWAVLGGLRFALASIVFWTHFGGYVRLPRPLAHISDFGAFAAVLGFFVVSGYSIAASLERDSRPGAFYERRLTRIYPTFFACMILACIPFLTAGPMAGGGVDVPKSAWSVVLNFLLLGGIVVAPLATIGVVWSLVIETVYYLLAPAFHRVSSRWLLGIVAVSAAAYWLHTSFHVVDFNEGVNGSYGALALAWAWLLGFLLQRHPKDRRILLGGIVLGCLLLGRFDQYGVAHFSCAVFAGAVAFIASARSIAVSCRMARLLDWLGELSYPLYLCHAPILILLYGGGREWTWPLGLLAVAAGSIVLLHGVDLPYRAYARRRSSHRHDTPKSVSKICVPLPLSLPE